MTSLKDRSKKSKTVFTLAAPSVDFLSPSWPEIPRNTANDILSHLMDTILAPISEYNSSNTLSNSTTQIGSSDNIDPPHGAHPLRQFLLVGTNQTTGHLESLSNPIIPSTLPAHLSFTSAAPSFHPCKLTAVFVTRSDSHSSLISSHLPLLCALTSTPLISLPEHSEAKLVKALRPKSGRVHVLSILETAPGCQGLSDILKDGIGMVEIPQSLRDSTWLGTSITASEMSIGEPKKKNPIIIAR